MATKVHDVPDPGNIPSCHDGRAIFEGSNPVHIPGAERSDPRARRLSESPACPAGPARCGAHGRRVVPDGRLLPALRGEGAVGRAAVRGPRRRGRSGIPRRARHECSGRVPQRRAAPGGRGRDGAQRARGGGAVARLPPSHTGVRPMAKEEAIEIDGIVENVLPNTTFRVLLTNGHYVLATIAGKMRRFPISVLAGGRGTPAGSPYHLTRRRLPLPHTETAPPRGGGGPGV